MFIKSSGRRANWIFIVAFSAFMLAVWAWNPKAGDAWIAPYASAFIVVFFGVVMEIPLMYRFWRRKRRNVAARFV